MDIKLYFSLWWSGVLFASSRNVALFQMKWEIPYVPLSSDLWILGKSAAINHKDAD